MKPWRGFRRKSHKHPTFVPSFQFHSHAKRLRYEYRSRWRPPAEFGQDPSGIASHLRAWDRRSFSAWRQRSRTASTDHPGWQNHSVAVEPKLSFGRANPKLRYFYCFRHLEMRHGASRKQMLTRFCQPPCPPCRPGDARTVGRNSRIGIHLAINLRNQQECQAGPH